MGATEAADARVDAGYSGNRLRAVRRQRRLSLHDVEARSGEEFKASVLGAYERGERAISLPRLLRLAELYDVPADQLLPTRAGDAAPTGAQRRGAPGEGVAIDLVRLQELDHDEDAALIARYVETVQQQRKSFDGDIFTIRHDDLCVLAAVMGRSPEDLAGRLDELGIRGLDPHDAATGERTS